ncbi:hypothetical protein L1987_21057 [Smallanthus sonchifolius]|uniref:Uncharacterized protein n=1 Tax=Smallanthus sonchifolius TaxID=185202 RepID=A0ACB9IV80_9ASTR|nr:hypothetical protein L1987_21057 [Smallanthus sonchifolius]
MSNRTVMSSGCVERPDEGAVTSIDVSLGQGRVSLRDEVSWLRSGATRVGVHAFGARFGALQVGIRAVV